MAGVIACDRCGKTTRTWDKGVVELRFRTATHCEPCQAVLRQVDEEVERFSRERIERTTGEIADFRSQVEQRIQETGL